MVNNHVEAKKAIERTKKVVDDVDLELAQSRKDVQDLNGDGDDLVLTICIELAQ